MRYNLATRVEGRNDKFANSAITDEGMPVSSGAAGAWGVATAAVSVTSSSTTTTTTTTTVSPYKKYDFITTFDQMWNRPVASGDYLVYLYSPASESCIDLENLIFAYADDAESPYPIFFMDITF